MSLTTDAPHLDLLDGVTQKGVLERCFLRVPPLLKARGRRLRARDITYGVKEEAGRVRAGIVDRHILDVLRNAVINGWHFRKSGRVRQCEWISACTRPKSGAAELSMFSGGRTGRVDESCVARRPAPRPEREGPIHVGDRSGHRHRHTVDIRAGVQSERLPERMCWEDWATRVCGTASWDRGSRLLRAVGALRGHATRNTPPAWLPFVALSERYDGRTRDPSGRLTLRFLATQRSHLACSSTTGNTGEWRPAGAAPKVPVNDTRGSVGTVVDGT